MLSQSNNPNVPSSVLFLFHEQTAFAEIQMSLWKVVNHKACVKDEGKWIFVSLFTVNIRTHHKQTYSQRITFCSPIILLENPPFILMEIWIKYFQTEIREDCDCLEKKYARTLAPLLHTVRFTEVYVSHSETMGTLTVTLWLWSILEKTEWEWTFSFFLLSSTILQT